jgi:NAD(P)-dependent dehydrogenase (short-subunit alcohol dehydrogenase family)
VAVSRVALVTGADTGIGRAIAERLLRDGFALGAGTHSREDDTEQAIEELRRLGRVHWLVGDLADPSVPERFVRETAAELGPVDVLVNNAGLTEAGPALELGAEEFDAIFAVDVRAAFLLAREAARQMADGGVILNVTSVHEHVPRPGFALYAAAKAALGMLTRGLALEWAERNIRVNSVAPGLIATPRNEDDASQLAGDVPLGRAGTPEEVAGLVSYLVSPEAAYVSGASILIDGAAAQAPLQAPAS